MPEQTQTFLAGEYFIAVQGFAMLRNLLTNTAAAQVRTGDVRRVVEHFHEFPHSLEFPVTEYAVEDGYTLWAPNYDGPNPAIAREEPIVHALLAAIPPGDALDAACGTGRHAAALANLGHRVIGVDTTDAMLMIAKDRAPGVDFRRGRLEALPVDDASIDVVTCALALTHVEDLAPVMREFARVLRPGGRAIISDMHPFMVMTGGVAAFPAEDGRRGVPFVLNRVHQASDYVRAFHRAGLSIVACEEPDVAEEMIPGFPTFAAYPDATRQAFLGLPYLLIWEVKR